MKHTLKFYRDRNGCFGYEITTEQTEITNKEIQETLKIGGLLNPFIEKQVQERAILKEHIKELKNQAKKTGQKYSIKETINNLKKQKETL